MELSYNTWHCTSENAEASRFPERAWKPSQNLTIFESSGTVICSNFVGYPNAGMQYIRVILAETFPAQNPGWKQLTKSQL